MEEGYDNPLSKGIAGQMLKNLPKITFGETSDLGEFRRRVAPASVYVPGPGALR
jgi:hypothetical protein